MAITKISNNINFGQNKNIHRPNYTKITGYGALVSSAISILAIKNKKTKMHKEFAFLAGAFAVEHVAIIEYYKHIYKTLFTIGFHFYTKTLCFIIITIMNNCMKISKPTLQSCRYNFYIRYKWYCFHDLTKLLFCQLNILIFHKILFH